MTNNIKFDQKEVEFLIEEISDHFELDYGFSSDNISSIIQELKHDNSLSLGYACSVHKILEHNIEGLQILINSETSIMNGKVKDGKLCDAELLSELKGAIKEVACMGDRIYECKRLTYKLEEFISKF